MRGTDRARDPLKICPIRGAGEEKVGEGEVNVGGRDISEGGM